MMFALAILSGLHLSTVVGVLAVLANTSWPLVRNRRRILAVQALGSSLFGFHYLLIGAGTGAAMCAASIIQSVTAALVTRRGIRLSVVGATLLAGTTMTVLTWHGLSSAFALATGLLSASGRLQRDAHRLRCLFLGAVLCSMTHNVLVGSPWGLTSDTLALTMLAAGLWRGQKARAPSPTVAAPTARLTEALVSV